MALSGIKSKPVFRGIIGTSGPWQSLFVNAGYRVYPYQIGCAVRTASTGTSVAVHGLGEFVQNDYAIVCRPTFYGDSYIYVPDLSKVTRVTSDPSVATDDVFTITPAVSVLANDWLFNIGADGAGNPLTTPAYDGSLVTLYTDPVGNNVAGNPYFLAGQGGQFAGWIDGGFELTDLLVADVSGGLVCAIPGFRPGPEVL